MSARGKRRKRERRVQHERRQKSAAAIGAATVGAAVLAPGAAADTFTVDNLNNAGLGSFRRAVGNANTNPGLDQVVFQSTLSGHVTLNSAVDVADGVEIAGPGAAQVTLDGQGADRILSLYGLPAENRRVAVADLTLEDGTADYGGAIYSVDADLEITRSTITGNAATAAGGAVYSSNSSLTLADTNVVDNTSDAYGGGIYAVDSTIGIAGSRMTGNAAAAAGGAVNIANSSLTLADTNVIDNGSDGYGGGVYAADSTIAIARSKMTDNAAAAAGGAVNIANSSLTLADTDVIDNSSDVYGGGVYAAGSTIAIARSRMTGNAADAAGGAVYSANSALTLGDTRVNSNSSDGYGGGVYAAGSMVEIVDSNVTYNTSDDSGAGIAAANSGLKIQRTTVAGNESLGSGGGIYAYGDPAVGSAPVDIIDSSFSANYARSDGGGAYLAASGATTVVRTTLSGNDAVRSGGGLAVGYGANGAAVTIADSTLSGNRAVRRDGGGIMIAGPTGETLLQNVTISGNVAGRSGGGASVYNAYDTPVAVRNSTVVGNQAGSLLYGGGGIYQYGGDCLVEPNPIRPPRAACAGGPPGDTTVLLSTIVADNDAAADADLGGGGGGYSNFLAGFSLVETTPYVATFNAYPADSNVLYADPSLGPLYDNGGATYTHEPYGDSPALDAGIANGLAQDQRAAPRTVFLPGVPPAPGSDGTDIGSVEAAACLAAVGTPVSNNLTFREAKLNKQLGSAKLTVKVPFSGKVELMKTALVEGQRKLAEEAGKLTLLVKSRGIAKKRLNNEGVAEVQAKVTFAPDCGPPKTKSKRIRLLKR